MNRHNMSGMNNGLWLMAYGLWLMAYGSFFRVYAFGVMLKAEGLF